MCIAFVYVSSRLPLKVYTTPYRAYSRASLPRASSKCPFSLHCVVAPEAVITASNTTTPLFSLNFFCSIALDHLTFTLQRKRDRKVYSIQPPIGEKDDYDSENSPGSQMGSPAAVAGPIWIRFAAEALRYLVSQNRHGPHSKYQNVRSNQPLFLISSRFRYLPRKTLDSIVHIQMLTTEMKVP